jgi:hypothetical protein
MTFGDILPWLTSGGVTGVIALVFLRLHQSAIRAHEKRADGWERIAKEREAQLMHILMAVKEGQERAPMP